MKKKIRLIRLAYLTTSFLLMALTGLTQPYTYRLYVTNQLAVTDHVYQFDVFILNTSTGANPLLELAGLQFGLGFDTNIVNGGSLTPAYINGTTELNSLQLPVNVTIGNATSVQVIGGKPYRFFNLAGQLPPPPGSGSSISAVFTTCNHPGTRIGTFQISNTNPFTFGKSPNHVFSSAPASGVTNTVVTAFDPPFSAGSVIANITNTANHLNYNSPGSCDQNIVLNSNCTFTTQVSTTGETCSNLADGMAAVTLNGLPGSVSPAGTYTIDGHPTVSFNSNPFNVPLLSSGSHAVTVVVTGCGSAAPASFTIASSATPCLSAGGPTVFCTGGSVTLTSVSGSGYLWNTGATTQSIQVTASGSYAVSIAGSNPSPAITVTANPLPTAVITPRGSTTFCQGGQVSLTATASSSYLWSNGSTTQTITASAAGSYSVTVTDANGCTKSSSPATVTVLPLPVASVSAGGPLTFCAGGSVTLTAGAASTYAWSNGATTQSIVATSSGNYAVTVTGANGCTATSSATTVTVNTLPTASITAGGPVTFCAGGSVTLTAAPGTSYTWSNGSTVRSITVSNSGNYFVTVTNSGGCSATSSATTVTVNPLPVPSISANGPTTFCTGQNVTLTSGSATSYSWSNSATTRSIIVSASGNYSVSVTDANGCTGTSAPTSVVVNPAPAATITPGGATSFCSGGQVTLTAGSAISYLWSNGATTQSIVATGSGNYSVSVTGVNGCSATSGFTTVTVFPLPTANITAGGPTTLCDGSSVVLTSSTASSYLWSSGATTRAVSITATGSYTVTVTDVNGCRATSSSVNISVIPAPSATITPGGPTSFCTGGQVTLTAGTAFSYLWNTGSTTQSIAVSASGSYTVTVTGANACSATSPAVSITVYPVPGTIVTPNGPTAICSGNHVDLTVSANNSYLWSNNETTQTISVSSAGNYSVTVTDVHGCSASSAVTTVTVLPLPTASITANGPTAFCQGGQVILTAGSASSYIWNNGATTQSITVTATGNYLVTVMGVNGCSSASSATSVSVDPAPSAVIFPPGPIIVCGGGSVALTTNSASTYLWSNGATTQSITVSASGNFSVTLTSPNGCSATSTNTPVNFYPPAFAMVTPGGPLNICANQPVVLNATLASTYNWNNGETSQAISVSGSGNYSVTITDANGCTAISNIVSVTANPVPVVYLGNDTVIASGTFLTLDAGSGFASYVWSTGAGTQTIQVNAAGEYWVAVTNSFGCTQRDTISVTVSTGIQEMADQNFIHVFPNPSHGDFSVQLNLPAAQWTLRLFDAIGHEIEKREIIMTHPGMTEDYHLRLSAGLYLIKLTGGGTDLFEKIIVR